MGPEHREAAFGAMPPAATVVRPFVAHALPTIAIDHSDRRSVSRAQLPAIDDACRPGFRRW
jgi:hypothetical protein